MHRYPPHHRPALFPRVAMSHQKPAFWEGAIAAVQGKLYAENPHARESAEWLEWAEAHNSYRAGQIRSKKLLRLAGVA